MKKLSYFKEQARKVALDFEVILRCEPGASIASVTEDALRLVAYNRALPHQDDASKGESR